jgi:hypothetical protein
MRDAAFREYAETTRRELADLRKRIHHAIEAGGVTEQLVRDRVTLLRSRKRRLTTALPTDDGREDRVLAVDGPPSMQTRTDWFARELGDTWVEVEPGIYEHAALPPSGPPLRLASR